MTNNNRSELVFYDLLNWLEKYIEKAGYYSDWEQRKKIKNNVVRREDMNGLKKEDKLSEFATALLFITYFAERDKFSLEHQDQFYKGYFLLNDYHRSDNLGNLEVGSERNIMLVSGWKHKFLSRIIT